MMRFFTILALASILLLGAGVGVSVVPQGAASQQAPTYTYEGTVQELRTEPPTIELITGTGFALRVLQIRVTPRTAITDDAATLSLRDLDAGDVVRAECRRQDQMLVAERVERLMEAQPPRDPAR
jgi:hypothetical protein